MNPNNRKRLSIALAAYNGERFIREQLDSFSRQTRLPDELVVNDDCSTDGTVEIVREFATQSPFPVRLCVNSSNVGMAKNFGLAITRCTGDIIFPSDGDDVWLPHKLAKVEMEFLPTEVGIVLSNSELVDEHLRPVGRTLMKASQLRPMRGRATTRIDPPVFRRLPPFAGHAMAFRADCRRWILPMSDAPAFSRGGWDTWIGCIVAAQASMVLIGEPLALYRQHANQNSGGGDLWTRAWLQRRLSESSPKYYLLRAQEAELIRDRVIANGLSPESRCANFLAQRQRHFLTRARMRRMTLGRILLVLSELITLRYYFHSSGCLSVAKDLFVPNSLRT